MIEAYRMFWSSSVSRFDFTQIENLNYCCLVLPSDAVLCEVVQWRQMGKKLHRLAAEGATVPRRHDDTSTATSVTARKGATVAYLEHSYKTWLEELGE
jgi:hypothetical protein